MAGAKGSVNALRGEDLGNHVLGFVVDEEVLVASQPGGGCDPVSSFLLEVVELVAVKLSLPWLLVVAHIPATYIKGGLRRRASNVHVEVMTSIRGLR